MYSWVRPLLFCFPSEVAHAVTLSLLSYIPQSFFSKPSAAGVKAFGFELEHPIGLAAGFDKSGQHVDALAKLGFSFIEVGTITPRPQLGHSKPRLFRLTKSHALINRMGFNNPGVEALISNLKRIHYQGVLGINIGKNSNTPLQDAGRDYIYCMKAVYPYASYITINISSPNTPDLRRLQHEDYFNTLVTQLREEQLELADKHANYVPIVIKVSPDESDEALKRMADVIVSEGVDGIIATNTTSSRQGVENQALSRESGGLSGRPLAARSTECLRVIKEVVGDRVTLIGAGGIDDPSIAAEKLKAGATLLQVYTGLIYEGPGLIARIAAGI